MSAFINRIIGFGDSSVVSRSPLTDEPISSPLWVYDQVKKQINKIQQYLADTYESMIGVNRILPDVINENELKSMFHYGSKVKGICEVLTRDKMKISFFGRTSNGKSTVVNAILGDEVLPSGVGHITNCFIQVEGSQTGDAYLVTGGSNEKQNVESVTHLAHALNHEKKLNEKELVHLYWPIDKCILLRNDVALVDSPGVDVTPHLDDWIDAHCIDADVFVLVANAESTLTVTEKNFFHKVSTKLSKPNIFILNNRWDACANKPKFNACANKPNFIDQVRKQHMERATDFFANELKVCTPEEAVSRIFFISAEEVLQARVNERNGLPRNSGALAEGFSARYMEFEKFERRLEEEFILKSKFLYHTQEVKNTIEEMIKLIMIINDRIQEKMYIKKVQKKDNQEKLNLIKQQLINKNETLTEIHKMVDDVEDKVSKALNEEIHRLPTVVNKFCPEALFLNFQKQELLSHLEAGLVRNLDARLSTELAKNIDQCKIKMFDKISSLLPEDKRNINVISKREPFKLLYHLKCDKLCDDFHEQLQFKFSWGLSKLVTRVSSLANWSRNQSRVLISPSYNPLTSAVDSSFSSLAVEQSIPIISRVVDASVGTQGTMEALSLILLAVFIPKTFGWRSTIAIGAIYGVYYLYERLSWTTKAKEREFKRQFVDHVTAKLRLIVNTISGDCSSQVQQELNITFGRLCQLADNSATDLNEKIENLDRELNMLTLLTKSTDIEKILSIKADLKEELMQLDDFLCVKN